MKMLHERMGKLHSYCNGANEGEICHTVRGHGFLSFARISWLRQQIMCQSINI